MRGPQPMHGTGITLMVKSLLLPERLGQLYASAMGENDAEWVGEVRCRLSI